MITALGDAVVTALNASGLLDSETVAVRKVIPRLNLEATAALQVIVITPEIARVPHNRAQHKNTHTIQIGLIQQLADATPTSVDPMILLMENVLNLRYGVVTSGGRQASYLSSQAALFDAELLEQCHEFRGVVSVQFVEFQDP